MSACERWVEVSLILSVFDNKENKRTNEFETISQIFRNISYTKNSFVLLVEIVPLQNLVLGRNWVPVTFLQPQVRRYVSKQSTGISMCAGFPIYVATKCTQAS